MSFHKTLYLSFFLLFFIAACHNKKTSLAGKEKVKQTDFISSFSTLKLPYSVSDSNFQKMADTTLISYEVLHQFVPDSVLSSPKNNIKFYPVGKIEKEGDMYLILLERKSKTKAMLHSFLFDKDFHYLAHLNLLESNYDDGYRHSVYINAEPTFILSREKNINGNELLYTRKGYAYSKENKQFIVVINETNEDKKKTDSIINPIDTLPAFNRYSGDYYKNKKNFISLRDENNTNKYRFFIYFEKNSGKCKGELKGTLTMTDKNKAVYNMSGDLCIIDFTFHENSVTVKERGSCGNHRGMDCFFNDSYPKTKKKKAK